MLDRSGASVGVARQGQVVAELLDEARDGSPRALGELYRRYRGLTVRVARRYGVADCDVDDVVSEVWLRVQRALSTGAGPRDGAAIGRYLGVAVRSTVIDSARRQPSTSPVAPERLETAGRYPFDNDFADVQNLGDPAQLVTDRLEGSDYDRLVTTAFTAFHGLPSAVQVLLRRHLDGVSNTELAGEMGISVGAAASRLARARALLRSHAISDRMQGDISSDDRGAT